MVLEALSYIPTFEFYLFQIGLVLEEIVMCYITSIPCYAADLFVEGDYTLL